ncbi:MAG: exodeoxyribonuclease beta subunit, partial [Rhizobacter sp.]|nr:exodeoxyribonuclease beta subunit [Rhizobacter sp.]
MSDVLDPLHLPLWGSRLVEASAGTGKTWTIAALYLRLVLGHGEPGEAFERALAPSEILVMTFTRAATRELSDRIRSRLLEAAQCFRGEQSPDESDAFLRELMDAYAAGDARSHAAWRLSAAAEAMDDAAVHTIDAWCQRMLREHAFDSGNLFDEELMADELNMTEEAARDYWRQQLYPLSGGALDAALDVWPSVDTLIADVRSLIEHSEPGHGVPAELGALVTQVMDTQRQALKRMKGGWAQRAQEMRGWLDSQFNSKSCPFSKNKIHPRYYGPWLDALGAWAGQPELHLPSLGKGRERFTPGGMSEALNGKGGVELHPHFEAFEALMTELEALPSQRVAIRRHAAACVKNRLDMLKEQAGAFGFADMLDRLDAALAGPNAQRLRERIVTQYPVALIDEFQDTSAVQFRIFDRLYRAELNDASTTLLLIGDPKQSIYGFRGADLDSYLRARSATTGRHYVLGTNHRSTTSLVAAVNRLFDQAEARPGQGAFLFRQPGGDNPLPFVAVQARGRAERLINAQGPVPALTVCHDAELRAGGDSQRRFAARCAEHIVTLLDDPQARYVSPDGSEKRLRHADIAVLVRSRVEAAAVRRELRRRGVASVYLSENDSVFDSGEARDLLHWLKAVASPLDMRLARAAMATATVGLSMPELARLASDEDAYEQRSEQLRELHTVWLRQGVLAMLRQSLHRLALPSRWLHETDGERRLTNVLHLAELLQTASTQLDGEQALIRWLGDQIEGAVAAGDERIVRLESDADLV